MAVVPSLLASSHCIMVDRLPVGHLASVGDGQAPDQHQRTEALLPGDGRQHSGIDRMGEEALLVPRALTQNG